MLEDLRILTCFSDFEILFIDLTDNTKEPLDSYYIHFSSSENYIDNLYEKF